MTEPAYDLEPSVTRTAAFALRSRLPRPLWFVYRLVRSALVASAFAWFWLGGVLLAWTVLPLVTLLSRDKTKAPRTCQRIIAAAFRLFHGYMRVLRLVEIGKIGPFPLTEDGRGTVLIANHTTLVDVTAIVSQVPNICCVSKSSYFASGFVGRLLKLAGFLDAGSTVDAQRSMIEDAKQRLADGYHVLIFPEGTRSPEGGLWPFHRGAFEIACQAKVRVQPITLRCDPSALRRGQPFYKHPDTCAYIRFVAEEPVDPASFNHRSRPMRDALEANYRSRLGVTSSRLAS